jgi:hypothetical protein
MMDRPFAALAAFMAVALLVASWIVMRCAQEPDAAPEPSLATVYRSPSFTPGAEAGCGESQPCYHVPAVIDWLPSLSDGTRTVLAEFALDEGQPAAVESGLAEAAGPDLLSPLPAEAMSANGAAAADSKPVALPPLDDAPAPAAPAQEDACLQLPQPQVTPQPAAEIELKPDLLVVPAYDPSSRSRDLEMIARQADAHTKYGFELAGKGAYFSARSEFVMALRLVAQGLDAEYRTKAHSRTLA